MKRTLTNLAAAASIAVVELDAAEREVALRLPRKQAMRDLARRLADEQDEHIEKAIRAYFEAQGMSLDDPEQLRGRLTVHQDQEADEHGARGDTYAMDGVPVVWIGPVKVEGDEEMRASRAIRHHFWRDSEDV